MRTRTARIGSLAAAALGALIMSGFAAAANPTVSIGTSSDLRDCAAAAAAEGWSGTWTGAKLDGSLSSGTYGDITISNRAGNHFDWWSASPVTAVFVKAGPGANLYRYNAGSSDTGLVSPQPDSISHMLFCVGPTVTQPAPPAGGGTPESGAIQGGGTIQSGGTTTQTGITQVSGGGTSAATVGTSSTGGSTPATGGGVAAASVAAASVAAASIVGGITRRPGALTPPVAKKRVVLRARTAIVAARYCARIVVAQKTLSVGRTGRIGLAATAGGKALAGLRLRIAGAGIDRVVRTGSGGRATVRLTPSTAGIVRIAAVGRRGCNTGRIGAVGSFEPPVTG